MLNVNRLILNALLVKTLIIAACALANGSTVANNEEELYSRDFYSVPTTVKTYENDTVLLPCGYKSSYRLVRWLRDEELLMEAPYHEEVYLNRYHLLSNGSLVVMDVQTEDTGRYFCEMVSSTATKAVQAHAIEVQYAPRVFATPSGLIELPIGAVLEIICETEGVPQPAVTWTHNNETIIDYLVGNRQTHIVEIKSREMSGHIECVARNGVGEPIADGVELLVLFAPEIRAPHKIYYSKVGGRVAFECFVESSPMAKVRWFHAGKVITPGSYHTRQDNEVPLNASSQQHHYYSDMRHALTIKTARESDMGMYECRAENIIGVQSVYMELTFRPMPCTFKISPDMQSPTSHILVWQTESYAPVMEFKLKFRQVPSESAYSLTTVANRPEWTELTIPSDISIGPIYTTTYTLYGLHPASIYQVVVLARNHFGWSDSSKILRFATGGEVEFPNYSTEADRYGITDDLATSDANGGEGVGGGGAGGRGVVRSDGVIDANHNGITEITSNDITENPLAAHKDKTLYSSMYVYSSACRSTGDRILNWWIINVVLAIIIVHKFFTK